MASRFGRQGIGRLKVQYARERDRRCLDDLRPDLVDLSGGKIDYRVLGRRRTLELLAEDIRAGVHCGVCETNSEVGAVHFDIDLKVRERWTLDDVMELVHDTCLAALQRSFPASGATASPSPLEDKHLLVLTPVAYCADGQRRLETKPVERVLCGRCAGSLALNQADVRYECGACGLGYAPEEPMVLTHRKTAHGAAVEWICVDEEEEAAAEGGAPPPARVERTHKIGVHVVARNVEWEGARDAARVAADPTAGPFLTLAQASEVNDLVIATAQRVMASRLGADFPWDDVFDPSIYGERSSLRMPGCTKTVRCDTCRGVPGAERKTCWSCDGDGKVVDKRRYAVVGALRMADGARVGLDELPFDASDPLAVLHATSVRAPVGMAPTPGYARVEGVLRQPRSRGCRPGEELPPLPSEARRKAEAKRMRGKQMFPVDERTREAIQTLIREGWTRYARVTVVRCAKTKEDGGVVIVNVGGEGATFCHHKKADHTSSHVFFQITMTARKDKAYLFQRCFSPHAVDGVRCKEWNRSGTKGVRVPLPFALAATLFASYRGPSEAAAGDAPDVGGSEGWTSDRGSGASHQPQPTMAPHRLQEIKSAARAKQYFIDKTYRRMLKEGAQILGGRLLALNEAPLWRLPDEKRRVRPEIAWIHERVKGRGEGDDAVAPPPAKRARGRANAPE